MYSRWPPTPTFRARSRNASSPTSARCISASVSADPAGSYGLGIVLVEDMAEAEALRDADPAVTSPHGLRAEIAPMFRLITPNGTYG